MTDAGGRLNYRRRVRNGNYGSDYSIEPRDFNPEVYMGSNANGALVALGNVTKKRLNSPSHFVLVGKEMLHAQQTFAKKWGNSGIRAPDPNFNDGFLKGHIRLTRGDHTVTLDQDLKARSLKKEFTSSASNTGTDMIVAGLAELGVKPPLRFYWDKSFNHLKIPDDLTAEFVDEQGKAYPLEFPKTVDPRNVKLTLSAPVSVPVAPQTLRECGIDVPPEQTSRQPLPGYQP